MLSRIIASSLDYHIELINFNDKNIYKIYYPKILSLIHDLDKSQDVFNPFKYELNSDETSFVKGHNIWVAKLKDDTIIGFIGGIESDSTKPNEVYILDSLYINNEYRRLGVGKELLNHSIAYAKLKKYKYVTLGVYYENKSAIRLYESLGFKIYATDLYKKL
jgi:ribosomal protein S18 acetylase RimI-like enzyme